MTSLTNAKALSTFAVLGLFALPTVAMADMTEGLYGTAQLGYSIADTDSKAYGNNIATDDDFPSSFEADNSMVGGIGLGYQFNRNLRIEGRLAKRSFDIDDSRYGTGARDGEQQLTTCSSSSKAYTA